MKGVKKKKEKEKSYVSHSIINPRNFSKGTEKERKLSNPKVNTTPACLAFEFLLTQSCTLTALLSPRLLSRT